MRSNYDSKWEPNWVRYYSGGQVDQGEVFDDCYYVTSVWKTFRFKDHVIIQT